MLAISIFLIGFTGYIINDNQKDVEILLYMLQHYPDDYAKLYEDYATDNAIKKVKDR